MKIIAPQESVGRMLRWAYGMLLAMGLSMLAYCAYVLGDTWVFQHRTQAVLARQLPEDNTEKTGVLPTPEAMAPGGLIGSIAIARLGVLATIVEGTDTANLRRAVGHVESTGMPGRPGNIGLAGHRDTFFRPLKDIRADDIITVTTVEGEYRYRVISTRVVVPTEVSVLDRSEAEILTLVTCYPFYFLGSAPDRFIVRAERIS